MTHGYIIQRHHTETQLGNCLYQELRILCTYYILGRNSQEELATFSVPRHGIPFLVLPSESEPGFPRLIREPFYAPAHQALLYLTEHLLTPKSQRKKKKKKGWPYFLTTTIWQPDFLFGTRVLLKVSPATFRGPLSRLICYPIFSEKLQLIEAVSCRSLAPFHFGCLAATGTGLPSHLTFVHNIEFRYASITA
ncbi:hypothetical protein LX32DRAFT_279556 [Colletotrichum zoysiae]|uniref:Uncharacterized protein n=1 Tax=Colletotrichum zoysiae TaxID=1216348 RepID=A0AAD9M267_9PEZI|nr:hypothetical protein LX32DRAFT_279556 [Colletotrichum zoysiae]